MKKKRLTQKRFRAKRTKYTLKYNHDLVDDWPEITQKEWERIETDEAFREGFLLAIINDCRQN